MIIALLSILYAAGALFTFFVGIFGYFAGNIVRVRWLLFICACILWPVFWGIVLVEASMDAWKARHV